MKAIAQFPANADAQAFMVDAAMIPGPLGIPTVLQRNDAAYQPIPKNCWYNFQNTLRQSLLYPCDELSPFAAESIAECQKTGCNQPGLSHLAGVLHIFCVRLVPVQGGGEYKRGITVIKQYSLCALLLVQIFIHHPWTRIEWPNNAADSWWYIATAIHAAMETRKAFNSGYLDIPKPMGSYVRNISCNTGLQWQVRLENGNELLQHHNLPLNRYMQTFLWSDFEEEWRRLFRGVNFEAAQELKRRWRQLMR